ncbi:MAG TPA: hypothetical protein VHB69_09550 [Mycobacteriales bacterium]|nr:hypothetical protein [Mycobacteriales bacterium]
MPHRLASTTRSIPLSAAVPAALGAVVSICLVATAPAVRAASVTTPGLSVTPQASSVMKGGAVSLTVSAGGGSAGQQVSYVVVGRNEGVHGSVTTGADGSATISYRDHGGAGSSTTDTIALIDAATDESATATVDYLDGPDLARTVALDPSGQGVDDASCGEADTSPSQVPLAAVTVVCAAVTNSLGEPLAGKAVTFSASDGSVGPVDGPDATAATTYQALTDRAGVAFAAVTSTTPGAHQVVATADQLSSQASIGYAPPGPADAATVSLRPASTSIVAGHRRQIIATVRDRYANPVAGVAVDVHVSGPGSLLLPSGGRATTRADGTLAAIVGTVGGRTGRGAVTVTITASPALCATGGSCSATAPYDVTKPVVPATLTLVAAPGAQVGAVELVAGIAKGKDGTPAPGQLVRYRISGADPGTGTAKTNAKGVALFGYSAAHAGSDLVRAWVDVRRDGRREADEPAAVLRIPVAAASSRPSG